MASAAIGSAYETAYHNKKTVKFNEGWMFDRSQHCPPQYTHQKAGCTKDTSKWASRYATNRAEWKPMHAYRDTYVDQYIRGTTWVPGVGAHRTRSEYPLGKGDVVGNFKDSLTIIKFCE